MSYIVVHSPCNASLVAGLAEKVRERLSVVDATVELWMRRSAGMLSRGSSETDTDVLQVRPAAFVGTVVRWDSTSCGLRNCDIVVLTKRSR